jgi:hypothetical protein
MDLDKIASKKKPVQATGSTTEGPVSGLTLEKLPIERMEEYGKIHAEHIAKAGGSRKSKGEAELEFFSAFFGCYWSKNVTTKLLQNHLLQSDLKALGFDPLVNPILAFFLNPFTKELLENGLLDKIKYKAIHNAVAKHLMPESEYIKENNYNILYCLDLYNKTAADIETYLTYQKNILVPSMKKYSDKTKARNVQIFLVNGSADMQSANAKLNTLEDIQEIIEKVTGKSLSTTDEESDANQKAGNSRENFVQLVNQIGSEAEIVAFLQYISMSAGHNTVKKALTKFSSGVSTAAILEATGKISALTTEYLGNKRLTKAEAQELLELLIERYSKVS